MVAVGCDAAKGSGIERCSLHRAKHGKNYFTFIFQLSGASYSSLKGCIYNTIIIQLIQDRLGKCEQAACILATEERMRYQSVSTEVTIASFRCPG